MAKIKAPNEDYTGISAGVRFVAGLGETDEPHLIEWFRENGYHVEGGAEAETGEASGEDSTRNNGEGAAVTLPQMKDGETDEAYLARLNKAQLAEVARVRSITLPETAKTNAQVAQAILAAASAAGNGAQA